MFVAEEEPRDLKEQDNPATMDAYIIQFGTLVSAGKKEVRAGRRTLMFTSWDKVYTNNGTTYRIEKLFYTWHIDGESQPRGILLTTKNCTLEQYMESVLKQIGDD